DSLRSGLLGDTESSLLHRRALQGSRNGRTLQDAGASGGSPPPGQGRRWTVTDVPRSGALSIVTIPPQDSTSRRTIASPSPVPVDRVEKCGSKTRGSSSGGIPAPSSST